MRFSRLSNRLRLWAAADGPLVVAASTTHAFGAAVALIYNSLLRDAMNRAPSPEVTRAGQCYAFLAFGVAAVLGSAMLRRLKVDARLLKEGGAESKLAALRISAYPLLRALLSSVVWLAAIPVLATVALRVNGRVDPVGFPNFVASIVIAWLASTLYSSIFNTWLVLKKLARSSAPQPAVTLVGMAATLLPSLTLAVPLAAVVAYLGVLQPWLLVPVREKALERFLLVLAVLGAYGWVGAKRAVARMLS
jgi:hypothetical protein